MSNVLKSAALTATVLIGLAGNSAAGEWEILSTNTRADVTAGNVFSLSYALYVSMDGRLWDTWDTTHYVRPFRLSIIDSRRNQQFDVRFTDIAFNTDSSGFICGEHGVLLETHDWGKNWVQRYFKEMDRMSFYGLEFANRNVGVLIGSITNDSVRFGAVVYRTDDGGKTWKKISNVDGTGFSNLSYDMTGERFIVTALAAVSISKDKGKSWEYIPLPAENIYRDSDLEGDRGIVIGYDGVMMLSLNAGLTWSKQDFQSKESLLDLNKYAPGFWYLSGTNGKLWVTKDFGETWEDISPPTSQALLGVQRKGPLLLTWGRNGVIARMDYRDSSLSR
ncbi:MAG: hypothetical protein IIB00_03900 [candidate division Zixibacteria bacterium]|nr:hypothetical protein [candidate division Zixibacteria bacterium]